MVCCVEAIVLPVVAMPCHAMPMQADQDRLRKLVIELVLSTDMKQHFSVVSHFSTVHRLSAAPSTTASSMVSGALPHVPHTVGPR